MAHGYLGDGYGKYGDRDPDGGSNEQDRNEWRGEQRGDWRERDRYGRDRDEGDRERFMFEGSDRDRGSESGKDRSDDRGFFSRTADEARDWFGDDEHGHRRGRQERGGGDRSSGRRYGGEPRDQRSAFSSHQDDHYLSWRQQQMDALDRDYQDYCRERQQQFHSDFDSWRSNRQSQQTPGRQGSGQPSGAQATELELSETDELAGTTAPRNEPQGTVSPEGDATLGTNNPANSGVGRG